MGASNSLNQLVDSVIQSVGDVALYGALLIATVTVAICGLRIITYGISGPGTVVAAFSSMFWLLFILAVMAFSRQISNAIVAPLSGMNLGVSTGSAAVNSAINTLFSIIRDIIVSIIKIVVFIDVLSICANMLQSNILNPGQIPYLIIDSSWTMLVYAVAITVLSNIGAIYQYLARLVGVG